MKSRNLLIFAFATGFAVASCGGKKETKIEPKADSTKVDSSAVDTTAKVPTVVNIVETAKTDTGLSMLVDLLATAGLAETLSDETAQFTVFAPTNEAFRKLGDKKLASLKEEKNKEMLKDILLYHVVSGNILAADVTTKKELDGMNEKVIKVTRKNDKWMVAGATITATDIACSNGSVHVIDAVMMPPSKKSKAKNPETTDVKTDTKNTDIKVDKTTTTQTTTNDTKKGH